MRVNDTMKQLPKNEERQLTYCIEGGRPLWIITKAPGKVGYKLYKCVEGGYQFLKSSREPLFKEVMA